MGQRRGGPRYVLPEPQPGKGCEFMPKSMTGDIRRGSKSRMRRWRKFICAGTTFTVSGTAKSRPTLELLFLNSALVRFELSGDLRALPVVIVPFSTLSA